jgi:hypothetical protein
MINRENAMGYKEWRDEVEVIMKNGTPEQVELCQNWLVGIGLQKVDNLQVSGYLLELAFRTIFSKEQYHALLKVEIERMVSNYRILPLFLQSTKNCKS